MSTDLWRGIAAVALLPLLVSCGSTSGGFAGTPEQEAAYTEMLARCQQATGARCSGNLGGTSEVDVYGEGYFCRWRRGREIDCSWN
ncbi:hypothetical protein [Synechococcus sp. LA31]|uniref:hypothetical protein n=1 Tax=Synechococcus sp. LA31 TaxID=2741953 RepID=UPI001BDC734C|nr:hypothetical protein [Synechococcus sp. LA31]QVV66754.1 hypothetical protein KJJ24_09680 [Synechococcus sp. LA31]